MSSAVVDGAVMVPFARAHDSVDELLCSDLSRLDGSEVLESWRELERLRNRLAAVEHRYIVAAERRGLAAEHGCRDVVALMRGALRVTPGRGAWSCPGGGCGGRADDDHR